MTETTNKKQGVSGLQVKEFKVKKARDIEKVTLVLEANVDELGVGNYDVGDLFKALWAHQAGEVDVGFSVFMKAKEEEDTSDFE